MGTRDRLKLDILKGAAVCDCGRTATHMMGNDAECDECRELNAQVKHQAERETWLDRLDEIGMEYYEYLRRYRNRSWAKTKILRLRQAVQ